MAVLLATLVSRLQADVPARDSVPSSVDYAQHVKDAVLQFSQDAPMRKHGTLSVVSGTADYALPSDFLFLIDLPTVHNAEGVLINASGIIPLPTEWWEEDYTVAGSTLTIMPTPTYTLDRTYRYAAIYALSGSTGSETYANLTENGARVALLYAQHLALTQQGAAMAGSAWKYSIGDESIDKSMQAGGYRSAAEAALKAYHGALQTMKGYGSWG